MILRLEEKQDAIEAQTIRVDWRDEQSIQDAEDRKFDLECKGYTFVDSHRSPSNWNVNIFVYTKPTTFSH